MSDSTGWDRGGPVAPAAFGPYADFQIRIARDGVWFHKGAPIERLGLAKLFGGILRLEDDGFYWLVTPAERGRIEVEDSPFVAVEMDRQGSGEDQILSFRTNLDHWAVADSDHPIFMAGSPCTGEMTPYLKMDRGLSARLAHPVYYDLAELSVPSLEGSGAMGIWSKGAFFPLFDGDAA